MIDSTSLQHFCNAPSSPLNTPTIFLGSRFRKDYLQKWFVSKHTGISLDDVKQVDTSGSVETPAYFVAVDHSTNSVVLSIRGTFSLFDAVIDLLCKSVGEYVTNWRLQRYRSHERPSRTWFGMSKYSRFHSVRRSLSLQSGLRAYLDLRRFSAHVPGPLLDPLNLTRLWIGQSARRHRAQHCIRVGHREGPGGRAPSGAQRLPTSYYR